MQRVSSKNKSNEEKSNRVRELRQLFTQLEADDDIYSVYKVSCEFSNTKHCLKNVKHEFFLYV